MALIQHAWAGEQHNSESIKYVNGNETARNHAIPTADYWVSTWRVDSVENVQIDGDIWEGYTGPAVKITPTSTADGYDADTRNSPVSPGQYVAFSILLAAPLGEEQNMFQIAWIGSDWSYRDRFMVTVPPEGIRHVGVIVAPDDVQYVNMRSTFRGDAAEGRTHLVANAMLAVADSEDAALAQVETYFDGDTPDYYDNATAKVYTNNGWATLAPRFYI